MISGKRLNCQGFCVGRAESPTQAPCNGKIDCSYLTVKFSKSMRHIRKRHADLQVPRSMEPGEFDAPKFGFDGLHLIARSIEQHAGFEFPKAFVLGCPDPPDFGVVVDFDGCLMSHAGRM